MSNTTLAQGTLAQAKKDFFVKGKICLVEGEVYEVFDTRRENGVNEAYIISARGKQVWVPVSYLEATSNDMSEYEKMFA